MKISDIGEFELIEILAKKITSTKNNRFAGEKNPFVGIGDDAAAWLGEGAVQLATVDCMAENVHFTLDTITWRELGWKALATNLSDIAAMGGKPTHALVSMGLPEETEVDDVAALYDGMLELANRFGVAIMGGNTIKANEVSITVTLLGNSGIKVLRRSTAKPGEKIAVTGYLGSAGAGREMLTNKLRFSPEHNAYLREAFVRPVPRIAEGQRLLELGVATGIDISDGLMSDLKHICRASFTGARIEAEKLPLHPAVTENFGGRAVELAVMGGEDYELLFTADEATIGKVNREIPVTVIGEITADDKCVISLVDAGGRPVTIGGKSWEHFGKG